MTLIKHSILIVRSKIFSFIILFTICLVICSIINAQGIYKEKYRPSVHYTPAQHWINDPNGLVYFAGEYHLFYQYNPFANVWGHMTWGHAVSQDLVHWKELPPAISEEGEVMIFSGSAVIDENNSSGFATRKGEVPMVAIYTGHIEKKSQSQHIAYSLDKGRSWTKYKGNPVLDLGTKEFRDPKVFWYAPEKKWVMAVVLPIDKKVLFYSSKNLKEWAMMSSFGPAGDTTGIWECPDLFKVPIDGSPGKFKWVLMHSPAPYMQYFVGEFDGTTFVNENPSSIIYRPDYGPDYYAAIVYNGLPAASPPISIGWVNNWEYARDIPVSPWNGAMSLPRELRVKKSDSGWLLLQQPVKNFSRQYFGEKSWSNISTKEKWSLAESARGSYAAEITLHRHQKNRFDIGLAGGALVLTYDDALSTITLKRQGNSAFQNEKFLRLSNYSARLRLNSETLTIKILFDQSIAEIYVNGGEAVMTAQVFPEKENQPLTLRSDNGDKVPSIKFWQLKSIWNEK